MNYTLRWCGHDGQEKETPGGTDLECAVDFARVLSNHYDGVEVVDEAWRVVWPDPADVDLEQTTADAAAGTQTEREMDKKTIIQTLKACACRECSDCPYRGKGIACKYRLMLDAANMLAATMTEEEDLKE